MRKARLFLLLCLPCSMLAWFAPAPASAAVDMFLVLDSIPGETQDKEYKDAIDVLAFSWGVSNGRTTKTGKESSTANFQDVSVTKYVDRASPELFNRVASGEAIPNAVISVRRAGDTPATYMRLCMSNVRATSLSTGGSGGEDRLTESISLSYGAIAYQYYPQSPSGTLGDPITAGWDVIKGLKTGVTGCS